MSFYMQHHKNLALGYFLLGHTDNFFLVTWINCSWLVQLVFYKGTLYENNGITYWQILYSRFSKIRKMIRLYIAQLLMKI